MRKKIYNFVGPWFIQKLISPPFWWLFTASAKIHDHNYKVGGSREDRLKADLGFLHRTLRDANQIGDFGKKKKAVRFAIYYYFCVRIYGVLFFKKNKYAK
jgi:hypothetical protein